MTTYLVPLTDDEIKLLTQCIDWTRQTLFLRKDADFPHKVKESAELGYKLDCIAIDYWTIREAENLL